MLVVAHALIVESHDKRRVARSTLAAAVHVLAAGSVPLGINIALRHKALAFAPTEQPVFVFETGLLTTQFGITRITRAGFTQGAGLRRELAHGANLRLG